MKGIVAAFLPLCIFSFLAFGISVAILGTEEQKEGNITSEYTVIDERITDIDIHSDGMNIRVFPSDNGSAVLSAKRFDTDDISLEVVDGRLTLYCHHNVESFEDFFSNFDDKSGSTVELAVPLSLYNSIAASVNAGTTEIIGLAADTVDLELNAGELIYAAPEGTVTPNLYAELNAGNCALYNAASQIFELSMKAGNMDVYGLSGNGEIDVSAGNLTANFAKLDGDINVDVSAGNVDLNLPVDISAQIECECTAGEISVKHGDEDETLSDGDSLVINDGSYGIICDITAGGINITDNVKLKTAPYVPATPLPPAATQAAVTTMTYNTAASDIEPVDVVVDVDPIVVKVH